MAKKRVTKSLSFANSRFTSIVSIALVLFLIGNLGVMALLGNKLSDFVKENITFSVLLEDKTSEQSVGRLKSNLEREPFVKSVEYISKEQAAKELEEELGENPEVFLGYNPLQSSLEVKLNSNYANPDSLLKIERTIKAYSDVEDLLYRKEMMELVANNSRRIGAALIIFAIIFMLISFVLINNTIRLIIYSKRFLIHTMKLVGATPGFIRKPIVRYQLVSGFFASLLSLGLMFGVGYYFVREFPDLYKVIDVYTIIIISVGVLILGLILSWLTTTIAVNRFLRMDIDKLYYI